MARILQHKWTNDYTEKLLSHLADTSTLPKEYAVTMYDLGRVFGEILFNKLSFSDKKVSVASTVEDADYLAKGIIDVFESKGKTVYLTVFWNKRFKPNPDNNLAIAPILKEFHDPGYKSAEVLIILKSIIANACVVKTNLTRLIDESAPDEIYVIAPVLLHGAIEKLEMEFSPEISAKFQYVYFAEDDDQNNEGMVLPGIGGDVYKRLGFKGQDDKNRFIPEVVTERRKRYK